MIDDAKLFIQLPGASFPPISHTEGLGTRAEIPWQTELLWRESMALSSRRRYGGMAEVSPP
jgi:hypothetical protein